MGFYYTVLQSRSHAFILERRLKNEGIDCELVFIPKEITMDLCNMGVRFKDIDFGRVINVIKHAGLPECRVYLETVFPNHSQYLEIPI